MQVTIATSGLCWQSPNYRASVIASARQNSIMGAAFLAVLHLVTGIL